MSKYETKYRVIENCRCNDYNDELPYTIVAVDYDPKTDLIRQRGFNGWGKHSCDLFSDRRKAEGEFVEKIIPQTLQENQKLKSRWKQLKEYINKFKENNIEEANMAWIIIGKMQELEKEQNND